MSSTAAPFSLISVETQEPARLSMQRLWLTGEVLPAGARLTVEHVFRSAEQSPLEVIYSFGLPRDAALRSFRITGDGFETHSELKTTEDATRAYEQAITTGSLAAMTRQYGDGVINLTVGNIRPDETVTVALEILAGVELRDDGFRFRFPFTLAPGYHPRARVFDGERELPEDEFGDVILPPLHKDASGLHQVGFELSVVSQSGFEELGSPSHTVRVRHRNSGRSWVALAQEADVPDRDLVLDARFSTVEPQVVGGGGRFAAIVPSASFGANPNTPRHVVILLDRSGSMSGVPLEQAAKSIRACLGVLSEQDLFGLVAFDDKVETFEPKLLPGSRENREKAHAFLNRIDARGGTELANGFTEAVRILGQAGGDVLILTDGQVSGTEEILARARATNTRLHCLGIGSASQDRFLALLARETGGVSRFVTPRERVDLCAVDLFASIGRPVATGLKAGGDIQPVPPETVISGTPVVLFGKGAEPIQLTWDGGRMSVPVPQQDEAEGETIRLLQGARLITDWDSRYPSSEAVGPIEKRKQSRVANRLRELSEEYGLASREMSLVAVVNRSGDRPGELPETRVVPVGMPQDTSFEEYFGSASRFMARLPRGSMASAVMDTTFSELLCGPVSDAMPAEPSGPPPAPERRRGAGAMSRLRSAFSRSNDASGDVLLLELAAEIEPDGGMPGKDVDARAGATIVALLAFLSQGHSEHSGIFRLHIARLISFLKLVLPAMPSERARVSAAVLVLADKGQAPSGDWIRLVRKPEKCWRKVESAINV